VDGGHSRKRLHPDRPPAINGLPTPNLQAGGTPPHPRSASHCPVFESKAKGQKTVVQQKSCGDGQANNSQNALKHVLIDFLSKHLQPQHQCLDAA